MIFRGCELAGRTGHAAGRQLLAELFREVTGEELPPIAASDRGKPFFVDSPWHFSISHTKNHAFCVLSEVPVGLDAEELTRQVSPKLAEKILSAGEYAQWQASADKNRALLTFWVLKEAAAKLTGEGLRGYPNGTDFSLDDPRVLETNECMVAILTEKGETHAF